MSLKMIANSNFCIVLIASVISVAGSEPINCTSASKPRVSLCCSWGQVRWAGSCVDDEAIASEDVELSDAFGNAISREDYSLCEEDPCDISWMVTYVVDAFTVDGNGSIHASELSGWPSELDEFCLLRYPNSDKYVAKICRPWVIRGDFEIACVVFAIIAMLIVFTVYTVVPELQNRHGLILRCYIATYISAYLCALGIQFTTGIRTPGSAFWFTVFDIALRWFAMSCALWLNVMSFNIWRSFRNLRPVYHHDNNRKGRSIVSYAIFVWFTPVVTLGSGAALMIYVPYFRDDTVGAALKLWACVLIVVVLLCVNVVLYTMTALKIKNLRSNTSDLIDGVNRHHEDERRWFDLYLKLFAIMGSHIAIWPVYLIWPILRILHFIAVIEVVQSILIFIIFVWKRNVGRFIYDSVIRKTGIKSTELD